MRTILYLVWKEYLQVFRDRPTVFQIFFIPIVQLLVLSNAATFEVTNARTHVVDLDRSTSSRGLVTRLAASKRFVVRSEVPSMDVANEALLDRDVSFILQIPHGFERDLVRNGTAPVQFVVNAEEGAAAGIVQSYAFRVVEAYSRELSVSLRPRVTPIHDTRGETPPRPGVATIDVRARGWFNPTLDYKHYMVPGLLVSLTTVIGMLLTAQNIAREKELGTLEQLNVTPITKTQFIFGKLLPFWLLALVTFSLGLVAGKLVFGMPTRGSLLLVYGAAAVYLVVALGIGLWISAIAQTQQQTLFISFFIMMIYLLMSGLFTPIDSMPPWAQWAAELNPVKHFVIIMRAVLVKGADLAAVRVPFGILAASGAVVLTAAVVQYNKRSG
jgi:ABC-2 type transport system permease protein